jgi:hypothetical protein
LVIPSARDCVCVAQRLLTLRACTHKRHSMHGVVVRGRGRRIADVIRI